MIAENYGAPAAMNNPACPRGMDGMEKFSDAHVMAGGAGQLAMFNTALRKGGVALGIEELNCDKLLE